MTEGTCKLVLFAIISIVTFLKSEPVNKLTLKFGIILMTESDKPFDMRRVLPSLTLAFERIEEDLDISVEPVIHNYTGSCPWDAPVGKLSKLYHEYRVAGIIGPACSQGLESAGRLAQYLKIPIVSGLGDLLIREPFLGDMYETLTILSYNLKKLSYSMSAIMAAYGWKHTAILYDITYVFFDLAGSNLVTDFRDMTNMERPYDIPFVPDKVNDFGDLLLEAKMHARVFIIFCNSDMLRDFLYKAYLLNMANGDYVFITMELFPSDWLGYYTNFLRNDEKDVGVTKAYESVLILTLRQPDSIEYNIFAEEVKRRAKTMFNFDFGSEEVNYFITAFYDSAIYLAMAYRKTLQEGGDINDGMAVAQKLWNSSFSGITGPVAIDAGGNRIADFDLLDMKSPETREFQLVGRFRGATQLYNPSPGISIVWPTTKPEDMPPCGFNGELCIPARVESNTSIVIAAVMSIVCVTTIVMIAVGLLYRKMRIEQEIGKKAWMVTVDEIQVRKEKMNDSFMSKSCLSLNVNSKGFGDETQIFTQTAFCRGHTVALRKLAIHSLELDRKTLIEFRQMQLVSHSNLAKFVGACLEPGNLMILMEYCPRGSLQDMLENESIELDWSFRYSLISDIIKGMLYLHNSPIHAHGRLTSTNCVIDSRFCLKLTDYGLITVFTKDRQAERKTTTTIFNMSKLLWTAPEHLQEANGMICRVGSSQKGDVFSFGIILQEIALRAAPYEYNDLPVEDIIKRISSQQTVYPIVPVESCKPALIGMMKQCWCQAPKDRPTFGDIDEVFRKMRAGKTTNIMDNLLQRMEQYADNLEALAAERTKKYLEEKQKAEELLHRLLPESVAKQLEIGNAVVPETFECVTIYFSDIVGFTSLAAMSTPIEVVDFLNDLYTSFDSTIDKFDVYKVETIGDAYMVVSGLPERNCNRHVIEICNMSLMILHVVRNFKIRHVPDEQVRIRIGIHSGPVVAGVVGLTMPRYCLFGDTVNTASRMESTSERKPVHFTLCMVQALKIHVSNASKKLLDNYPGYSLKERGEIQVKGKGNMLTYWLDEVSPRQSVIHPPFLVDIPGTSC